MTPDWCAWPAHHHHHRHTCPKLREIANLCPVYFSDASVAASGRAGAWVSLVSATCSLRPQDTPFACAKLGGAALAALRYAVGGGLALECRCCGRLIVRLHTLLGVATAAHGLVLTYDLSDRRQRWRQWSLEVLKSGAGAAHRFVQPRVGWSAPVAIDEFGEESAAPSAILRQQTDFWTNVWEVGSTDGEEDGLLEKIRAMPLPKLPRIGPQEVIEAGHRFDAVQWRYADGILDITHCCQRSSLPSSRTS